MADRVDCQDRPSCWAAAPKSKGESSGRLSCSCAPCRLTAAAYTVDKQAVEREQHGLREQPGSDLHALRELREENARLRQVCCSPPLEELSLGVLDLLQNNTCCSI